MSPPARPSRKDQITEAAFELVRERGLAGLRVRELAKRVGVTEGALYRHFPSKEAIFLALADRVEELLLGPISGLAGREELPARDRLEGIVRHHMGVLLKTDSLPMLLVAEASFSEHEELRARMRGILVSYLRTLERLTGELPQSPSLKPADVAFLLMGLSAALAIRHRLVPDPVLEERLAGPFVHELLERLLAG